MKQPYKINIDPTILDDLKARIANARWTDEIEKAKRETGTNETLSQGTVFLLEG